jgi:hypothetical protein
MSARAGIKTTSETVLIRRGSAGAKELECGWSLIRIEPESGNAICERAERRIICPRREFELLNFPGSDEAWDVIINEPDDELKKAGRAWAALDLRGAVSSLIRYASRLDPAFNGVQIPSDLTERIDVIDKICKKTTDLLRVEAGRKRDEYERRIAQNGSATGKNDDLLSELRDLEDRYATQAYRLNTQLPAWRRLDAAIHSMDAVLKK